LWKDVDTFVEQAKEGASRCCGDDLTDCKCPQKDTADFRDKIGAWCQGVKTCFPCQGNECDEELTTSIIEAPQEEKESIVAVLPEDYHHSIIIVEDDTTDDSNNQHVQRDLLWVSSQEVQQGDCPKDDQYAAKCLESVMPPYPICTKKTVDEWVVKAWQGHDDCCGDDMTMCKCPQKNSAKFAGKLGDWCAGVETCPSMMEEETITETGIVVGSLRATPERLEEREP
jgi:hypothetical protein